MLDELLQDRAALYVSGAMTADERDQFELILEFHDELRAFTGGMSDVAAAVVVSSFKQGTMRPPADLKARLLAKLDTIPRQAKAEGFVMSGPDGLVQWVNPAFTEMCGYTLDELRGKSLGPILQGKKTDRETSERMRRAVKEHRPCRERILNYHKSGEPYWVDIAITPILDDAGRPLWMVARERELAEPLAA
ncbi:MAG: PAS domain-containing protein [Chthoniobacteraceae bacterium]